ncbi:MAG: RIP metalloprotease RseP [Gammaproteobacteria bacterium]
MLDIGLSLLAFIVAIGLLVSVHEFGHFWVARKLGFKVERFSIGFGKPLARWRGRGPDHTEYWLAWLPLGGYVKMLDEREGPVPDAERERAFNRRPPAHRIAVLLAGPGFNFIFAVVAYWLLFMTGVPGIKPYIGEVEPGSTADAAGLRAADVIEAIDGNPTETWEHATLAILDGLLDDGHLELQVRGADGSLRRVELDVRGRISELTEPDALFDGLGIRPGPVPPPLPPVVGEVTSGSPAERAGLLAGDRVVEIDGEPVETFEDLAAAIRARPGETVPLLVERGQGCRREGASASDRGQAVMAAPCSRITLDVEIGRAALDGREVGQIGVASPRELPPEFQSLLDSLVAEQRYGPIDSVSRAVAKTWEMSALTVRMLGRMVVGDVSMRNISGPIAIAGYAGDSAQAGLGAFLSFLAIVSISLGILNLLPVPILDGGQIVFQLAEWIKGSPLSERALAFGQQLGILLMILLMGFVFYNDLSRVFS